MENFKNDKVFAEAVENYEVAESLSSLRWGNKKAKSIYSMAFDNAKAMMNIIAEEYEVSFEDVLSAVRDVAKL